MENEDGAVHELLVAFTSWLSDRERKDASQTKHLT
jgi:hypothetical protein